MERDLDVENDLQTLPSGPSTAGILWETYCNNLGNTEQNEQMKKRPSARAIMCKFMKVLVFRKESGVERRVIRDQ
jgi:hypothetical protein